MYGAPDQILETVTTTATRLPARTNWLMAIGAGVAVGLLIAYLTR